MRISDWSSDVCSSDLLFFVKHLIGQWAKRFEQQLNLKLFGQRRTTRKVEHNLDGLMRGDFKARAEAVARLVQGGVYTPAQCAEYMGQETPADPATHKYYIQGDRKSTRLNSSH